MDAAHELLQAAAREFVRLGREQERSHRRHEREAMENELRAVAAQLDEERAKTRRLEEERSAQRAAFRDAVKQSHDEIRARARDAETLARTVLGLRWRDPEARRRLISCAASGDAEALCRAIDPWSSADDDDGAEDEHVGLALDAALRAAACAASLEACRLLLSMGADPTAQSESEDDPHAPPDRGNALHGACRNPKTSDELVRELVSAPESLDALDDRDARGKTALMLAAEAGNEAAVKTLLRRGADPDARDDCGKAAIDFARRSSGAATSSSQAKQAICSALMWGPELHGGRVRRASRLFARAEYERVVELAADVSASASAALADAAAATTTQSSSSCSSAQWRPSAESECELRVIAAKAAGQLGRHVKSVELCTAALMSLSSATLTAQSRDAFAQRAASRMQMFAFAEAADDYARLAALEPAGGWEASAERARAYARRLRDHYLVLGVKASSTSAEIRRAFLQRCLRWHPDKNRASAESLTQAEAMFKAVSEAHAVLIDAQRRASYDASEGKRARVSASDDESDCGSDAAVVSSSARGSPGPGDFLRHA